MSDEIKTRTLTEGSIPDSEVKGLIDSLETNYLKPQVQMSKIKEYSKSGPGNGSTFHLRWRVLTEPAGAGQPQPRTMAVHLTVSKAGVRIEFPDLDPNDVLASRISSRVADTVEYISTSILNKAKRKDLRFIYSVGKDEGKAASGGSGGSAADRVLKRIFTGNAVNLFLSFMLLTFVLSIFLGNYTVIVLFCGQALVLIFSDRIMLGIGKVSPIEERPEVTIVRVASLPEAVGNASKTSDSLLKPVREALGGAIEDAHPDSGVKNRIYRTLVDSGIPCTPEDVEITTRNPYRLVHAVAERYHLPLPKIAIVNTGMDNAAATGIAPSRATVTITAGALEDLDDDEITAVLGHEFGHVRGHDTVILFLVTSLIYYGGFFVWPSLFAYLGLVYFVVAFGIIYMVGKFLETRADTLSAIVVGTPDALASALTKIGFTQLYLERYHPGIRVLEWFQFDSHPPIYFRVQRLARISHEGSKIKHAFWASVRDCFTGFAGSFTPS